MVEVVRPPSFGHCSCFGDNITEGLQEALCISHRCWFLQHEKRGEMLTDDVIICIALFRSTNACITHNMCTRNNHRIIYCQRNSSNRIMVLASPLLDQQNLKIAKCVPPSISSMNRSRASDRQNTRRSTRGAQATQPDQVRREAPPPRTWSCLAWTSRSLATVKASASTLVASSTFPPIFSAAVFSRPTASATNSS